MLPIRSAVHTEYTCGIKVVFFACSKNDSSSYSQSIVNLISFKIIWMVLSIQKISRKNLVFPFENLTWEFWWGSIFIDFLYFCIKLKHIKTDYGFSVHLDYHLWEFMASFSILLLPEQTQKNLVNIFLYSWQH